ncbi:heme oxygenase [Trapelia coarctata]|nr:heme oxygenase [Trapelia coarctata]
MEPVLGTNEPLSQTINTATREHHTRLNRLIVARLPLALPPQADDPTLYALGLQRFAFVYLWFESVWTELVALQPLDASQTIDHRILSALKHLYLPELLRTPSLRNDLSCLLRQPVDRVDNDFAEMEGPHIQAFLEHFEKRCASKPHVLIAYAWVFYMALFNGGRWIRAQLLVAEKGAWNNNVRRMVAVPIAQSGLSFWHFPGDNDGEEIKAEFKARLADVEGLLTTEQQEDIVDEACMIFDHCELLAKELDETLAARPRAPPGPTPWVALFLSRILPMRLMELLYASFGWVHRSRWYAWIMVHWGGMREGDGGEQKTD